MTTSETTSQVQPFTGPSLSPSRASDFMQCPLLYRYRVIDKLPEPPAEAAVLGTLVHAVLERLYDKPAVDRTLDAAYGLIAPSWKVVVADEPEREQVVDGVDLDDWFMRARSLLDRYFTLEDPRRLEPADRELYVETVLDNGLRLRGYIDRVDVSPDGLVRVVDYKTGRAPSELFERKALFQMKFYALVWWKLHNVIPAMLQLVYLRDGQVLRYQPDEHELQATERKIVALRQAISRCEESGQWQPRQGRLCDWCSFQSKCPAFGGTPPPVPQHTVEVVDSLDGASDD